MSAAETISIQHDLQEISINKDFRDTLVDGGFIYLCDECGGVYHLTDGHTWDSLAQAVSAAQNDLAATLPHKRP